MFYLFLFSLLESFGHEKMSFLLYKLFFSSANHYCLRELHITCEQKIDRLSSLIETKYRSMPFLDREMIYDDIHLR